MVKSSLATPGSISPVSATKTKRPRSLEAATRWPPERNRITITARFSLQRHIDEAIKEFEIALKRNPSHPEGHYNLGRAF